MKWIKFSERQPTVRGIYWIAQTIQPSQPEHPPRWLIFPDYRVDAGSDGAAQGQHGSYREFDGYWFGPLEISFKPSLPAPPPVPAESPDEHMKQSRPG